MCGGYSPRKFLVKRKTSIGGKFGSKTIKINNVFLHDGVYRSKPRYTTLSRNVFRGSGERPFHETKEQ